MKYFVFTFFLLFVTAHTIWSQRTCGTMAHHNHLIGIDSTYQKNRALIELQTEDYINKPHLKKRVLKTIPVVVHVVYNTNAENISDAQIQSQIDILNADFRKLNADWTSTPAVFQGLVADCEIEFCLAQQDPNGAPTTGIVRKSTTSTSFSTNDNVKFDATGGSNIWNRNNYLNIWVCDLSGGLLGYAQFPGGPASTDGVVCDYLYFGSIGTATAPFNKGRTATHEIGHWLNLYHIWGDDGTSCSGSDQVNDTPNQADENYGCPTYPSVSCSNGPNGDLFMNYMDYVDDACMYMFTAGQKARMDALFATTGARVSLLSSPGCVSLSCNAPTSITISSITSSSANINWTAAPFATSYTIRYRPIGSTTWLTSTSTTTSKLISGLNSNTAYEVQIQSVCTSNTSSYTASSNFTTLNAVTCTNSFEPNNTRATAQSIANNASIQSMIGSTTDFDYFTFTTTSNSPKVQIELSNLPYDYELKLYKGSNQLIGSSMNAGNTNELIKYNLATTGGTYIAYVYGYNGAFSTSQCYTMTISTSANNFKIDPLQQNEVQKPKLTISPNPAQDKMKISFWSAGNSSIKGIIYNQLHQKIASQETISQWGENSLYFDLKNVPRGLYYIQLIDNDEAISEKLILE